MSKIFCTHITENGLASEISTSESERSISYEDTLDVYGSKKGEELFASIELEKLNHESAEKLNRIKENINEYMATKAVSPDAASNTEIGQMLDNPDVWEVIAKKMLD